MPRRDRVRASRGRQRWRFAGRGRTPGSRRSPGMHRRSLPRARHSARGVGPRYPCSCRRAVALRRGRSRRSFGRGRSSRAPRAANARSPFGSCIAAANGSIHDPSANENAGPKSPNCSRMCASRVNSSIAARSACICGAVPACVAWPCPSFDALTARLRGLSCPVRLLRSWLRRSRRGVVGAGVNAGSAFGDVSERFAPSLSRTRATCGLGRVHTNGTKKAPFSDRYSP